MYDFYSVIVIIYNNNYHESEIFNTPFWIFCTLS